MPQYTKLSELLEETCCGALGDKCEFIRRARQLEEYIEELEGMVESTDGWHEVED